MDRYEPVRFNVAIGGQYMFYYQDDDLFFEDTEERVNGAIPLAAAALDVDLDATRSDINFLSPEIIFRYQIQYDSLVSRFCGTMASPGSIQRDWNQLEVWFACANDGSDEGEIYKSTDDGKWEKISNPYKIGTIEEISIGHVGGPLSQQIIFSAHAAENIFLIR